MELSSFLRSAIVKAGESFAEDELAFLALTSKIERPFLDRVGFQLHGELAPKGFVVAREYPVAARVRADVAVLKDGALIGAIEGKAMYTADCIQGRGRGPRYPQRLDADLQRYVATQTGELQVFSLLLATHPRAKASAELRKVIKYSPLLNRAFKTHGDAEAIERVAQEVLGVAMRSEMRVAAGKLSAGTAYGIPVELMWWLYGPFGGKAGWAILRTGAA